MKLSNQQVRVGKSVVTAIQLDNGPWVGVIISDVEMAYSCDEDAITMAKMLARHREATRRDADTLLSPKRGKWWTA